MRQKCHSDCGGEFANDVFQEINKNFGIETSKTPGESPFSNGKVERGNAMLYDTMMITMEDVNCNMETTLAWAVSAKNASQNTSGYSPNQLVFGPNFILPSIDSDAPPAMYTATSGGLGRKNVSALHKARENFVKSESSDRIRRALKYNVRTYSEVDFQPGERVYYKRRKDKGWRSRGPAKVLGKETNFVLIRHGSAYFRCHPCQLMKLNDVESGTQQVNESDRDNKKVIFSQKDESSSGEDTPEEKGSQTLSSSAEEKESQALSISVDDTSEVCPVNHKNKEEK